MDHQQDSVFEATNEAIDTPAYQRTALEAAKERIDAQVADRMPFWLEMTDAEGFRAMELEAAGLGRELADAITRDVLEQVISDPGLQAVTTAAAMKGSEMAMRRDGIKEVPVRLLGGSEIRVRALYIRPEQQSRPGPRRKPGKRGKSGVGLYPVLAALGICEKVTPALGAEVARQVAGSDSFRPALEALKSRGIDLGYKTALRIANAFGQRAVEQRNAWVEAIHQARAHRGSVLAGKRVVVGIDGGRTRVRVPNSRGRRRKSGHRGFETPWREPKLFVIYVVDAQGEVEAKFRPVYDGTMADADAVYRILTAYLKSLGAEQAAQLIVVADGAEWIWNRVAPLVEDLGLPADRAIQVVDWYHAVEYLGEVATLGQFGSPQKRARWLKQAKDLLWAGDIEGLLAEMGELAKSPGASEVLDRVGYFQRNASRMQYRTQRAREVPIGSGAVESAIRRIINLRIKGNSKFWLEENAEGMILMRGYLKAGRFDDLVTWSNAAAVPWWNNLAWLSPLGLDLRHERSATGLAA